MERACTFSAREQLAARWRAKDEGKLRSVSGVRVELSMMACHLTSP